MNIAGRILKFADKRWEGKKKPFSPYLYFKIRQWLRYFYPVTYEIGDRFRR